MRSRLEAAAAATIIEAPLVLFHGPGRAGAGRESRDRAVVPSAAELVKQLKEIARLSAEGALTKSEFEAVKARLLSDEASA
jgi:hypothetical protein